MNLPNTPNLLNIIRVFFLSLFCMILNIPHGPDAPSRSEMLSCSLDNGAIVCEADEYGDGYTGTFSIRFKENYKAILLKNDDYDHNYFMMKVFRVDADDPVDFDDPNFRPLYDDDYPGLKIEYLFTAEDDAELIREGEEFTINVSFTLSPKAKSGAYNLVFQFYNNDYNARHIYRDAVIVP